MKKISIFAAMLLASLLAFSSCEYDDGPINERLDQVEKDVTELKKLVDGMNTQISSLQAIVETLQGRDQIVSVKKVDGGFEVTFQKAGTFKIVNGADGSNGQDGVNGADGKTPVIGVKEEAGQYYWTVDGEFLLDKEGKKIPATAHIATPKIQINQNNNFEISYDGGKTWEEMGPAGEANLFKKVVDSEDKVIFTLADGTEIVVPKNAAQNFFIRIPSTDIIIKPSGSATVRFEVVGADAGTKVRAHATKGFVAKVTKYDMNNYSLEITAPATLDGEIYLMAAKENGENRMCILNFEEGVFKVDFTANTPQGFYKLDAAAGTFEIPVATNLGVKIDWMNMAHPWFREAPQTKAVVNEVLRFEYDENTGAEPRMVQFIICSKQGGFQQQIRIAQWNAESQPVVSGGKADLEELPNENRTQVVASRQTPSGWIVENSKLYVTAQCKSIPEGKVAPCLRQSPDNPSGKITSPLLKGGCQSVTFGYARALRNNGRGTKLQLDILQDGKVVKTEIVDNPNTECNGIRDEAPEATFVTLDNLNVEGDFQIVITNVMECVDGKFNDAVVLNLSWTGYSKQ